MRHATHLFRLAALATAVTALITIGSARIFSQSPGQDAPAGTTLGSVAQGRTSSSSATAPAPIRVVLPAEAQPPQVTPEQAAALERNLAQTHLPTGAARQQAAIAPPPPGSEAQIASAGIRAAGAVGPDDSAAAAPPPPPNAARIFRSTALSPTSGKSTINEPSVAQGGKNVFFTGNWYAGYSTNGGSSFVYLNPYRDMTDFCCDQDVVYDPGHDVFFWYRQGVKNTTTKQSRFRLGVSRNFGAGGCYYNFEPKGVNSGWSGNWFDYPQLSLGANYLYISTNVFNFDTPDNGYVRTVILRFPLDKLTACAGFGYNYFTYDEGWGGLAQGLGTTMYAGTHRGTTDSFRVYWWPESSNDIFNKDVGIPGWTFENSDATCAAPGGNWCGRGDSRVLAGWVANGTVAFLWNAKEGGGFPQPYINAVAFAQSTLDVLAGNPGRPLVWNDSIAIQYPSASPNARGDVAINFTYATASKNPTAAFAIADDFISPPPGWTFFDIRAGTHSAGAWGDYTRIRPMYPAGIGWTVASHTQQGGNTGARTEPRFSIVGRQRDEAAVTRWWDK